MTAPNFIDGILMDRCPRGCVWRSALSGLGYHVDGQDFTGGSATYANYLLANVLNNPLTIMSPRISIARPQTNSFNADPHGLSNSRPSTGYRSANPDDPIEILRNWSKQIEDNVEIISQPLKPHLPAIGRFLIVVTFLEDALRILTQWSDQIWYLQQ